jgi:predicted HTH domain antitoxin
MAVTFELPKDIELHLRHEIGDLSQAAKEATLIELYRQDRISHTDLSRALGLSRLEVEALLQKHHVYEDLPTAAEHVNALDRLRSAASK